MTTPENLVVIYKELADVHQPPGPAANARPLPRPGGGRGAGAGRPAEADLLLARLLRSNPHHMLRPFASFAEAMASPDIHNYVGELRHPPAGTGRGRVRRPARLCARPRRRDRPAPAPCRRRLPSWTTTRRPPSRPSAEPLKVYRVQDEAESPTAPAPPCAPRPAATRPPAPPPKSPPQVPRPGPRARNSTSRLPPCPRRRPLKPKTPPGEAGCPWACSSSFSPRDWPWPGGRFFGHSSRTADRFPAGQPPDPRGPTPRPHRATRDPPAPFAPILRRLLCRDAGGGRRGGVWYS